MHQLQQQILRQMTMKQACRYRDIKPKEVESNLFMYHLRRLISDGLVEKVDNHYRLTKVGLRFVDTLSLDSLRPRIQPKIATLLAVKNSAGKWLLYKRSREPFFGKTGFPYGKIHLGETVAGAANRELKEKTGITAQIRHVGDAYLAVHQGDELISHILFHVFAGTHPIGTIIAESEIGHCSWQSVGELANDEIFPGFKDIFELVKQPPKSFFFKEFSYQV